MRYLTTELLGTALEVDVEYHFFTGEDERGPSYSSGGEPAVPAEIEIYEVNIKSIDIMDNLNDETLDDLTAKCEKDSGIV